MGCYEHHRFFSCIPPALSPLAHKQLCISFSQHGGERAATGGSILGYPSAKGVIQPLWTGWLLVLCTFFVPLQSRGTQLVRLVTPTVCTRHSGIEHRARHRVSKKGEGILLPLRALVGLFPSSFSCPPSLSQALPDENRKPPAVRTPDLEKRSKQAIFLNRITSHST